MRIALCGKMASGKTTVAEYLEAVNGFERFSLAKAVKEYANFLFDIPEGHKDRVAYQKVGDGGRKKLYENLWIDTLLHQVKLSNPKLAVVDDVRYLNEVKILQEAGWKIIKIEIDDELQVERLKKTYPLDWKTHANARTHASESEVDSITAEMVDLVINATDDDTPINLIQEVVSIHLAEMVESRV